MAGSQIHNGVWIDIKVTGEKVLSSIGKLFNDVRKEAEQAANDVPKNAKKMSNSIAGLSRLLDTNLTDGVRSFKDEMDAEFDRFNSSVRHHINTYNSIIMGGVALSMSGLGIQRVGRSMLSSINGWTDAASEFEKVMRQVKFLGGVAEKDYEKLKDHIVEIGIALPVSNLDVAQGALELVKTGYSAAEAEAMSRSVSMLQFFGEGALQSADAAQFLNSIMVQTGRTAGDNTEILDKLAKVADVTAFSISELWSAWQSSRAGLGNLDTDLETFLTLMGVARTSLTPRYAGMVVNSFARAVLQASSAGGNRGTLWGLLGIDLDKEGKDPIKVLELVSKRSRELWGDGSERRSNLVKLFGTEALPIFQAYDKFATNAKFTMNEIRDAIKNSAGYSEEYYNNTMNTVWGLKQVYEGTKETFKQTMGEVFAPVLIPLLKGLNSVLGSLINLVREHPGIAKVFGYGMGLAGLLMVAGGSAMLLVGQLMSIYGTILNVTLQVATLGVTSMATLKKLTGGATTVGALFRAQVLAPLLGIGKLLLKTVVWSGLLYLAWRYDFLRIRTITTEFFNNLRESSKKAGEALDKMGTEQLGKFVRNLLAGGAWDRWTANLIKAKAFFDSLGAAVRSFKELGKFRISDEQFSKLKELGMLDTLENVLDIIYAVDRFFKGFINGSKEAWPVIDALLVRPLKFIGNIVYSITTNVGRLFGYFSNLGRPNMDAWEIVGEKIGVVLAGVIAVKFTFGAWKFLLKDVVGLVGKAGRGIWNIIKNLGGKGGGTGGGGIMKSIGNILFGKDFTKFLAGNPVVNKTGFNMTRAHQINWATGRPNGMHPSSGVSVRGGTGLWSRLMGNKVYNKSGQYLGRSKGLFAPLMQKLDKTLLVKFPKTFLGKAIGKVPAIAKFMAKTPVLAALTTGISMLTAKKGERLASGAGSLVSFGGAMLGMKAGAAIGTAVAPGIGTIIGGVLGTIAGGIATSPAAKWVKENFNKMIEFVLNELPERIGYWLGYGTAKVVNFFKELPEKFEQFKIDFFIKWAVFWNEFPEKWVEFKENFKESWKSFWAELPEKFGTFVGEVKEIFNGMLKYFTPGYWIDKIVNGFEKGYRAANYIPVERRSGTLANAAGGIYDSPIKTWVAEKGTESIIPVEGYRNRALGLWAKTGQMLGVYPSGSGIISSTPSKRKSTSKPSYGRASMVSSSAPTTVSTQINFGANSIVIQVANATNPADIKQGARQMFEEFKRLVEKENMRNYRPARVR